MLQISGDGRRAALDLRLVGLPQDTPGKTGAAATRIAAIWRAHRDEEYRAPDGTPVPGPGLAADRVLRPGHSRARLERLRGAARPARRARAAPRGRSGSSTRPRPTGTRPSCSPPAGQAASPSWSARPRRWASAPTSRIAPIALHHLDAPWRPADVAQREGRIVRQGNLNPEVQILRYVTQGSFDGYMWQALQRKAAFIGQVMHGRLDTREIGEVSDVALSFSEVKALATGNPLLMDKAEADTALARLSRAERAHLRNQDALRYAITRHEGDITGLTQLAADIDTAIAQRQDTRGEAFTMTVDGHRHVKRADAGQHLKELLLKEMTSINGLRGVTTRPGHLGGFPLTATTQRALGTTSVAMSLDGAPGTDIRIAAADLRDADPVGLITRLENRLYRLEERKATALADAERARSEISPRPRIPRPALPYATQLAEARHRARQIDEQLQQMAQPQQPDVHVEPGATSAPSSRAHSLGRSPDSRSQLVASPSAGTSNAVPPPREPPPHARNGRDAGLSANPDRSQDRPSRDAEFGSQ